MTSRPLSMRRALPIALACLAARGTAQLGWLPRAELPHTAALAYDAHRQRVVLFGGRDETGVRADTWEWDGTAWGLRTVATAPPARDGHAMAYDAARRRVVLFGGGDTDTWEWDGAAWSRHTAPVSPPPGVGHGMAFDAARARVVLFGSSRYPTPQATTWLWDGRAWTMVSTSGPSLRWGPMLAYDAARQRVVMVGGVIAGRTVQDAWEWDGSAWTQVAAPPLADLVGGGMAYDDRRRRMVLSGGVANSALLADTYEYDGTSWTRFAGGPPPVTGCAVAFDAARGRIVRFGGTPYATAVPNPETWERAGTVWSDVTPALNPGGRWAHTFTYHAASNRFVAFGRLSGTWLWDRHTWARSAVRSPADRDGHGVAYDGRRRRLVLFGGQGSAATLGDTHEWDGTSWLAPATPLAPPPRLGHAMAYDAARGHVVLFGGWAAGSYHNDTWCWDGTTWFRQGTPTSPAARAWHAMAYDPLRQRVVLFGGEDDVSGRLVETWEWDGATWSRHAPVATPSAAGAIDFDAGFGEVVMYGGFTAAFGLDQVWSWNGTRWARLLPSPPPPVRYRHGMAYDPVRRHLVVDGGYSSSGAVQRRDTGFLTPHPPASTVAFGTGCRGGAGVPRLSSLGRPAIGERGFALELDTAAPGAPAAFALALRAAALPLPGGCVLHLDPAGVIAFGPTTTPSGGVLRQPASIPPDGRLLGLAIAAQAFVLDAGNPLGLALTQGLGLLLGD